MENERLYRIGELADLSGVSPRTIDYYTQLGLLQACRRTEGNYRLYGQDSLERLRVIRMYREQGLHLAAIQERLGAADASGGDSIQAHLEQIQGLIEQMVRKTAEVVQARQELRAAAVRDQQARLAVSRAASDLLQKALVLSTVLASAAQEAATPMG